MSKEKSNKNKDVSLGHRHYWTDTQGHAHRVVFDEKTLEKPRATWIVLTTVTLLALIVGVALIISIHPATNVKPFVETPRAAPVFVLARTIDDGVASHATAIAAGWNDEFFLAGDDGVSLYEATTGKKLETWSFDEKIAPTALAFVADENSSANGLLLVGYPEKVKYLQFSLDQVVPASGANDATLPGGADAETEANNAVVRTADHGALGAARTLLTKTGADIRGLECSGERLFVGDYGAGRVWRYSLKKLYALDAGSPEPTPDCELGAPDETRGYPGLKPTFQRNFCMSYLREKNTLFVASPGLFRVDAFDPETGVWAAELSWSKAPGVNNAFHGASNPIAIEAFSDHFLVAESGVFLNASRQRLSPLRMFDLGGGWIADVDADYSQRPDDTTIASVSASAGLNRFFVLNTDGTVDVWEAR